SLAFGSLFLGMVLACALPAARALAQQDYPSRPVRIIAPFASGASGDLVVRAAGDFYEKSFKQPFVVDNRVRAGGLVGANEAKRSAPDGYKLIMAFDGFTLLPIFVKDNTISVGQDFAPISILARFPLILFGSTGLPAKTLPEFIAYAKANPG